MSMICRDIIQDTPEWLEWRQRFITASIIPAIMGASPYETPYEAIQYLRGLRAKRVSEWLTRRGKVLEDPARTFIEKKTGQILLPLCAESSKYDFLAASFDGVDDMDQPHEIKSPHEKQWNEVKSKGRNSAAYKMYRWQVLQQMVVAESEVGYLHFFNSDEPLEADRLITFEIHADPTAIQMMLANAKAAWQHKLDETLPKHSPRDVFVPEGQSSERATMYAKAYKHNKRKLNKLQRNHDLLERECRELEARMDKYGDGFKTLESGSIRITRWAGNTQPDWNKFSTLAAEASNISLKKVTEILDQCRGPTTDRVKASIIGQKRIKPLGSPQHTLSSSITFDPAAYCPSGDEELEIELLASVWRSKKARLKQFADQIKSLKGKLEFSQEILNSYGPGFSGVEINGVKITRFSVDGRINTDKALERLAEETDLNVVELRDLLNKTLGPQSRRIRVTDLRKGNITVDLAA